MTPSKHTIVILGHSNTGKSPLGMLIEEQFSTLQARLLHLDFGQQLRAIATAQTNPGLTENQIATVRSVMNGMLLADDDFPIATTIIDRFWTTNRMVSGSDFLVLNGLPRHIGQAKALAETGIIIETVIFLDCPASTAWERKLLADQGKGFEDRSHRDDAAYEIFTRKVTSFEEETLPVVDWYEKLNTPILRVPIHTNTSPEDVLKVISKDLWTLTNE